MHLLSRFLVCARNIIGHVSISLEAFSRLKQSHISHHRGSTVPMMRANGLEQILYNHDTSLCLPHFVEVRPRPTS